MTLRGERFLVNNFIGLYRCQTSVAATATKFHLSVNVREVSSVRNAVLSFRPKISPLHMALRANSKKPFSRLFNVFAIDT